MFSLSTHSFQKCSTSRLPIYVTLQSGSSGRLCDWGNPLLEKLGKPDTDHLEEIRKSLCVGKPRTNFISTLKTEYYMLFIFDEIPVLFHRPCFFQVRFNPVFLATWFGCWVKRVGCCFFGSLQACRFRRHPEHGSRTRLLSESAAVNR